MGGKSWWWVTPQVDGSLDEHQTDINGSARSAVGGLGVAQLQVLGDIAGGKPDGASEAGEGQAAMVEVTGNVAATCRYFGTPARPENAAPLSCRRVLPTSSERHQGCARHSGAL
jgi:hypothetical protein